MTGSKKKGLSIGAAMKQRMDSQEQRSAPEMEEVQSGLNNALKQAVEMPILQPTGPTETQVLESFNTRLPRSLHRRLKVYTATEGHKIQDVVAQALDEYLQQYEKKES
ncbi:hypothetical protein [Deinococcus marmoris]|uniref:hypothetical protein n=1 Tax=Deinococcus marmoris TaxID=249408 RepID=UPI0006916965|nr:hypothetical protein [Deinococcus marmoris]